MRRLLGFLDLQPRGANQPDELLRLVEPLVVRPDADDGASAYGFSTKRAPRRIDRVPPERVPSVRHGDGENAARPEHAVRLVQRCSVVRKVLQHLAHQDAIEGLVGKRERLRIPVDERRAHAVPLGMTQARRLAVETGQARARPQVLHRQ